LKRLPFLVLLIILAALLVMSFSAVALADDGGGVAAASAGTIGALGSDVLFTQFMVIVLLVLLDVVLTVAYAIGTGKFEWAKLLDFLKTNVLRYAIVWGVLAGIGYVTRYLGINDTAITGYAVFMDACYALIILRLGQSILTSFKSMGIEAMPK
jgi:hypothetical protein